MKLRTNLYLDDKLVKAIRKILNKPPKKSLSTFVEEKIAETLQNKKNSQN